MPSKPSLSICCQWATPASKTAVASSCATSSPGPPCACKNSKIQDLIMLSPCDALLCSVRVARGLSRRWPLVHPFESGRDLGHEARHLVLHLHMRLQAHIHVQDDLRDSGRLGLFQRVSDALWRTEQHSILGQVFGPYLLQPVDHVDEITVAWWRGAGVAG